MKYKIVKGLIEKSDFVNKYEKSAFIETVERLNKNLKEVEAQKAIYDAKADNVRQNHPHVEKLSEEKRNAIWLFHENFVASKQSEGIIKQIKKDLRGIKKEMKEIEKQTGIKFYE